MMGSAHRSRRNRLCQWIGIAAAMLAAFPAVAGSVAVTLTDQNGKALRDAVVYARPVAGTRVPIPPPKQVAVEQRDREFVPYVSVVQTGTTVTFPNRDALLHHVYSFSAAKNFEIKLYSGDTARSILFDKPGVVTLGCNIHDWMLGYVLVVDTAYFEKSGSDGRVSINDIVAGEFEIHVWHPHQRAATPMKLVKLDARANTLFDFTIDVVPRKKPFKPALDGIRYK